MESFAVLLEPYKDLIATSAATVTYFHQLSGAVICNDIRKQKSTVGFSVLPFLAGVVMYVKDAFFFQSFYSHFHMNSRINSLNFTDYVFSLSLLNIALYWLQFLES